MSNKKPFVLCISGMSATGKTTIAKYFANKYGFRVIAFDAYAYRNKNYLPKYNYQNITGINYELPESIDWDSFLSTLNKMDPKEKYIIDGFIPFARPEVQNFVDILIDIEFTKNDFKEALRRRVHRDIGSKVPKDYSKNPKKSSAHYCSFYYEHFVWPEAFLHPEYRIPINWNKPLLKLQGRSTIETNCNESDKFVSQFLNKKPFIVCISGISTSGKTTISRHLSHEYGFKVIHLDHFVVDDYSKLPRFDYKGVSGINYELPESIDWNEFISVLQSLDPNEKYIVDGFIPFYSNELCKFVDRLIDIEFDESEFNEALNRRVKRDTGSDVPMDYNVNPNNSSAHYCAFYFLNFVWKEAFSHPEYRVPLNWNKPLLKLSATAPIKDNCIQSEKFLNDVL